MEQSTVEKLFEWIDTTTTMIQEHMDETYLDSLIICMEFAVYDEIADSVDEVLQQRIKREKEKVSKLAFQTDELSKSFQLAILKGMKDSTQPQHIMTPDTIALLIGYLAEKLTNSRNTIRLFDPVSGTGNLLTIVMEQQKKDVEAYANEIDPTLLRLSILQADIKRKEIEFFHQDSLRPLLLDPVDIVVADLPVGYYPDEARAKEFELGVDEGKSYAHHLLIEQSMIYTKESGYLLLLIPEFLFESDQSATLHSYLHKEAHIIGLFELPKSAFKSKQHKKSILILQKKGEQTKQPKQPLLVKLPSLKDTVAMENILSKINDWFSHSFKNNT
ncbi:class I SAM-dependent methyltransferase [Virgibacillus sp. W0430]|uniref:class I SAM-dependent methyltransferase n=1 Tax=Virgibacillus sp. W0430 TaxID=3391580 RepID=UPI003F4709F8